MGARGRGLTRSQPCLAGGGNTREQHLNFRVGQRLLQLEPAASQWAVDAPAADCCSALPPWAVLFKS